MPDDYAPEPAAARLIKRAPAAAARLMFETVKQAIDECSPDDRFEVCQEIYEWALSEVPAHTGEPHTAYLVTLDRPVKGETGFGVLNLLRMVRGVIGVDPVPDDHVMFVARKQAEHQFAEALWAAMRPA